MVEARYHCLDIDLGSRHARKIPHFPPRLAGRSSGHAATRSTFYRGGPGRAWSSILFPAGKVSLRNRFGLGSPPWAPRLKPRPQPRDRVCHLLGPRRSWPKILTAVPSNRRSRQRLASTPGAATRAERSTRPKPFRRRLTCHRKVEVCSRTAVPGSRRLPTEKRPC
jgi:hypothetical protein